MCLDRDYTVVWSLSNVGRNADLNKLDFDFICLWIA